MTVAQLDASGLGGALRAPLGPVAAALVPRCALLPAPTPALRAPPPQARDYLPLVAYASRWRARSAHRLDSSSLERESELFGAAARTRGGGAGRERAARNERSSDWPQGGAQRSP